MIASPARLWVRGLVAVGALALVDGPVVAHPHVWVNVETTVVYENGTVTGLRQRWLFDEFYSSMAVQGLDANGDGTFDRSELAELANVNIEGLKEFGYFTFVKLGDQDLAFEAPKDHFMELVETADVPGQGSGEAEAAQPRESVSFWSRLTRSLTGPAAPAKPKVLVLEFTLPFKQPVLAEADGLTFSTYDPSYFIWFDLVKDKPIRLAGVVPIGCKADISAPSQDVTALQSLGEAAFNQGGAGRISVGYAKSVTLSCPR